MIVCDVCKKKVIATETEIHMKDSLLNNGFPIRMHLCHGHYTQLAEAVKLVTSIFRSIDEVPNETQIKEWIDRIVPWNFDEKGQRIARSKTPDRKD